jgi:predicted Zn-dependent protease
MVNLEDRVRWNGRRAETDHRRLRESEDRKAMTKARHIQILITVLAASLAAPLTAQRTKLEPGFNIFSVAQDLELGLKLSREMDAQVEIVTNLTAAGYIETLGKRLAARAPGGRQFRFQFKIANDTSINAAGLPGGIVYVNRGTIEAAANEAQLAGVIAHEIGHIVLRHGTHQISHAYILQAPLSTIGVTGSQSVTDILSSIGGGFTASSIVLRNPLEAENEADVMSTQILYDAGYDPLAAAQFLDKLDAEDNTSRTAPFLNGHPKPAARRANIAREIERLGRLPLGARVDSPEYRTVRLLVSNLPPPREASPGRSLKETHSDAPSR